MPSRLFGTVFFIFTCLLSVAASGSPIDFSNAIHVSPGGSDENPGSRDAPLATIARAVKNISAEEGGVIALHGGTYTEKIALPKIDVADPAPLTLAALPGAEVIFEGGQKITHRERVKGERGIFLLHLPNRQSMFGREGYLDVWDESARVRYGKMADLAGVKTWPGSICNVEGDRVFLHLHEGDDPGAVNLWSNRSAEGGTINRSNVTLHGLRFQNYLGGQSARALTLAGARATTVRDCEFINCAIGISNSSDDTLVEGSRFREVGLGVRHSGAGKDIVVRHCLLEAAVGRFAFSDVSEHLRNGIRVYYPGDGATVEQCVTAGFWAGLYIKTNSAKEDSRPYHIHHNTFLDGFRSGAGCRHPRTVVTNNLLAQPSTGEGAGIYGSYLMEMGARLEGNYFFGAEGKAPEGNLAGPDPLKDAAAGDLRIDMDQVGSMLKNRIGATDQPEVTWSKRMRNLLAKAPGKVPPLQTVRGPLVAASRQGAVITVAFNRQIEPLLFFREAKQTGWKKLKGVLNTPLLPDHLIAATPFEPEAPTEYAYQFALLEGKTDPEREYEFKIETAAKEEASPLKPINGTFATHGGPKVLHVKAGGSESEADGSRETPFAHLQDALDLALPGDTIKVAAGIYTRPVLLTHGGTPEARITIEGEGFPTTILDGGKQCGTMLQLVNAKDVTFRGLQVRWFGNVGLHAEGSDRLMVSECWFWNHSFIGTGHCATGVYLQVSPGSQISHTLFTRLQSCAVAIRSPGLAYLHNTTYGNSYSGVLLHKSARGSRVLYNSLAFTGNRPLVVNEPDPEAFASLVCDYNNYGSHIRPHAPVRPEHEVTPAARYGHVAQSKGIVGMIGSDGLYTTFYRMTGWREFSGKDQHSIFADPAYVDPLKGDFRLLPETPNLTADGEVIGALPVIETPQETGRRVVAPHGRSPQTALRPVLVE